jgi:hypothetical protein
MGWQRKLGGGILGFIGFMLSPFSWWNDLFVNVPLALGAAWVVAWFHPPAFKVALVIAYWMTNVLGLVLLHKGGQRMLTNGRPLPNRRREFLIDVGVSLIYTLIIVLLLRLKILQPVEHYLSGAA